jgi:MarR family transcriptional regulator, transcriptional regulator for hemolysin
MDFVGRELALVAKTLRARFEARLAEAGASFPAWAVLSCAIAEEGLSQRELAERIGIEGATLTKHLDRLEADGLIVRQRDSADRRIVRVSPTFAAHRLHRRLAAVAGGLNADLVAGLSPEEVGCLRRLLAQLMINLEESHAQARAHATTH